MLKSVLRVSSSSSAKTTARCLGRRPPTPVASSVVAACPWKTTSSSGAVTTESSVSSPSRALSSFARQQPSSFHPPLQLQLQTSCDSSPWNAQPRRAFHSKPEPTEFANEESEEKTCSNGNAGKSREVEEEHDALDATVPSSTVASAASSASDLPIDLNESLGFSSLFDILQEMTSHSSSNTSEEEDGAIHPQQQQDEESVLRHDRQVLLQNPTATFSSAAMAAAAPAAWMHWSSPLESHPAAPRLVAWKGNAVEKEILHTILEYQQPLSANTAEEEETQRRPVYGAMNRNARRPRKANHGKRPCSRVARRAKKRAIGRGRR